MLEVYARDIDIDPFADMAEDPALVPAGFEVQHQRGGDGGPRAILSIASSPSSPAMIGRVTPLLENLLPPGRTLGWQRTREGFRSHVLGERLFSSDNVRAALPELVELLGAQLTLDLDDTAEKTMLRRGDIHGQCLAIVDAGWVLDVAVVMGGVEQHKLSLEIGNSDVPDWDSTLAIAEAFARPR